MTSIDIKGKLIKENGHLLMKELKSCPECKSKECNFKKSYHIYKCPACNSAGDVISYFQKLHNLSFVEAVDFIYNELNFLDAKQR